MNLSKYHDELDSRTGAIRICVPEGSVLSGPAAEIHEMVVAYKSDGENFERSGDIVNSVASYAYALGWLDTGCSIGLLEAARLKRVWFDGILPVPAHLRENLDEKNARYELLLKKAHDAADPAPDRGSVLFVAAKRIMTVAGLFLAWGRLCLGEGRDFDALLCFSYGFAWLDAGVRAGLLCARENRDIFTI